ncbi:hypothetical protein DM01DRAFT_300427 [Hesseltinella vesiculosa]|uniref:Uncharacterized protein n=1 Tax=Hesseltinella vesiculosa TaxID=101127 RepID=A0A1X2GMV5_9FUNG|nr:hypothetical protein DM01DRAFT_300427 [Hesseltinella vesiculosa]
MLFNSGFLAVSAVALSFFTVNAVPVNSRGEVGDLTHAAKVPGDITETLGSLTDNLGDTIGDVGGTLDGLSDVLERINIDRSPLTP